MKGAEVGVDLGSGFDEDGEVGGGAAAGGEDGAF